MTDIDELKSKINDFIASHHLRHENNDADEIDLTGLSGLLADDQHVLDAEVLAIAAALSHKDTHDPEDGADALDCASPSANITPEQANAEGSAHSFARSDHMHYIPSAAPSELAGVQASAEGTGEAFARTDHAHQIQHAITDNHLVTVDGSPSDDENAVWTANGLEGYSICSSTFPTTPPDGTVFTHETTGRKIAYVYDADNTTWKPIISIGTMTLYVDKTDGTDDLDHGTGVDGDAFATVQYAVDCIPGLVGGNVTININNEDYDETVTIQGKAFTGDYTITLQGTLSSSSSGTQSANGVQGTGGTQGSFTDTGNLAGVANLLAYLDSDGDYRIIDSTDGDTATVRGTFTSQPLQNENYVVYDWGTTINKIIIQKGQVNVYSYDIKYDTAVAATTTGQGYFYRCYIAGMSTVGDVNLDTCYVPRDGVDFDLYNNGTAVIYRTKFYTSTASDKCLRIRDGAMCGFHQGSCTDGASQANSIGVEVQGNAQVNFYQTAATGYNAVRNHATGVYAYSGGQAKNTGNNQYSGNTADETATAASFGYID